MVRVTGFEPSSPPGAELLEAAGSNGASRLTAAGSNPISNKAKKPSGKYPRRFFGPSDWIRTSGLLNPIQARYQTSPHPDLPELSYISIPSVRMQVFFCFFRNLPCGAAGREAAQLSCVSPGPPLASGSPCRAAFAFSFSFFRRRRDSCCFCSFF